MAAQEDGPGIRPFQYDGNLDGLLSGSVNLYRGQVVMPITLVSLVGRGGLSFSLVALYQGVTEREATAWNMDSPVGVLGLGWSLPLEQIVSYPGGTANELDATYVLIAKGKRTRLIATQDPNVFVAEDYQFWSIRRADDGQSWTVLREGGELCIYGGSGSTGSGVRWDDWAGGSIAGGGAAYASSWDLRSITNAWGDQILFEYEYDEQTIGGGPAFTRSTRLKSVQDPFGRRVVLNYRLKDPVEIQPPHVNPSGGKLEAFQDAYETRYLSSIDATDFEGNFAFSVVIGSSVRRFGAKTAVDGAKRCLDRVHTQYPGASPEPGVAFDYGPAGSVAPGALLNVTTPQGSTFGYEYGPLALEDATVVLDIIPPTGDPRVWFGEDYVVMTFQSGKTLAVHVYNWDGGWIKVVAKPTHASGSVEDLRVVPGQGFFALYYQNAAAGTANSIVYVRDPFRPNVWVDSAVTQTVDRLVVGGDRLLIHPVGSLQLYPYRVVASGIVAESTITVGAPDVALASAGDEFAVFAWDKNASTGTASVACRDAGGTWHLYDAQTLTDVFWADWVRDSFWSAGGGFAAATFMTTDETSYQVCVMNWAVSRKHPDWQQLGHYTTPTSGKLPFTTSRVAGSVIANLGHTFRYDGATWHGIDLTPTINASSSSGDTAARYALGDDIALAATLINGQLTDVLVAYNAYKGEWGPVVTKGTGSSAATAPPPPTVGVDFATVQNDLMFRGAKSDWASIGGASLGFSVNLDSVKNAGPLFILSEDTSANSTYLVQLRNGTYVPDGTSSYQTLHGRRCYVPNDSGEVPGTILAGPGSFVTYSGTFGSGVSLTLYRVVPGQIAAALPAAQVTAVKSLTVRDGTRTRVTRYNYNEDGATPVPTARGATYDASATVAEFSKVVTTRDGAPSGSTAKYFLNGVAPEERAICYPPEDAYCNARRYPALMNGTLAAEAVFDEQGRPVEVSLNAWMAFFVDTPTRPAAYVRMRRGVRATNCVPFLDVSAQAGDVTSLDDGDVPSGLASALALAGTALGTDVEVAVYERGLFWLLLDENNDRALPVAYDGVGQFAVSVGLRSTSVTDYSDTNGMPRLQTATNMNAAGVLQKGFRETTYLCDALPQALKRHMISQAAQRTSWTVSADTGVPQYTGSQAVLYWPWKNGAPAASVGDAGPLDIWQSFRWESPEASSTTKPAFDAWTTGTPGAPWRRQTSIDGRTPHGLTTAKTSLDGTSASYVWDLVGSQTIARFANARASKGEAAYYAFEPNEANPGWTIGGLPPVPYGDDAHTGSRCGKIVNASIVASFSPTRPQRYYFSCWVKTPAGGASGAVWTFTSASDGHDLAPPLPVPDTGGRWAKLGRAIDLSGGAPPTLVVSGVNPAAAAVLVDNLRFSPMVGAFTARAVDLATGSVTASLDSNAATTFTVIDYAGRAAGSASTAGAGGWTSPYLWRSAQNGPTAEINSTLGVQARTRVAYGRFTPDSWTDTWGTAAPLRWRAANGTLTLVDPAGDTLTLREAVPAGSFALRMQVTPPATLSGSTSLQLETSGGAIRISLDPGGDTGVWSLSGVAQAPAPVPNPRSGPQEWCLIASGDQLLFFVAGQRVFGVEAPFAVGGPVSFIATQEGTTLQGLLVATDPLVAIQFQNGDGQPTQAQRLVGDTVEVSETIYDAIGRAAVTTKTAPVSSPHPLLAYLNGFAAMDWTGGPMTGLVSDYYGSGNPDAPSDDQGYPFTRTRFDDTPLDRTVEQGLPGILRAITAGGTGHTLRTSYGVNLATDFSALLGLPVAQYSLVARTDADGVQTFSMADKCDQPVARATRVAGGWSLGSLFYDAAGNTSENRLPAFYDPPAGTAANQFVRTVAYDSLGLARTSTSDGRTTEYVRDPGGRVRFVQDERGRAEGYYLYWTYDAVRRTTEAGCVNGAWDPTTLAERAANLPLLSGVSDWPAPGDPGVVWRKRLSYDGDGSRPDQLGALSSAVTATPDGKEVVRESYRYDEAGLVAEATTEWPFATSLTGTITYGHDALGNVVSISDGDVLDVAVEHDNAGRTTRIGDAAVPNRYASYAYHAGGMVAQESLNSDAVVMPRRYNSGWQPVAIGGPDSPFSEALGFDVRQDASEGYFDGRIASLTSAFAGTSAPKGYTFEYRYDPLMQLTSARCSDSDWNIGIPSPIGYDPNGNVLTVDTAVGTESYTYAGNAVQTFTPSGGAAEAFGYDANGAITRVDGKGLSLGYDRLSYLNDSAALAGGEVKAYVHNAAGQLVLETATDPNGQRSRFVLNDVDARPLVEILVDANGVRKTAYVHGSGGLLAFNDGTGDRFVLRDHLGSSRVVLDGTNAVVAGYDYSPFGALVRAYGPNPDVLAFRYTGMRWDGAVGLYDYGARRYDPALRRFYAPDPALQYASPYLYVGNNPLSMVDPTGAFSWNWLGGLIGAAEIVAGVVIDIVVDVATAGAGVETNIAIGALIGAGIQGLTYSITAGSDFSWGQFGIQEAIGGVAGGLTAGVGEFGGVLAGSTRLAAAAGDLGRAATAVGVEGLGNVAVGVAAQAAQDGLGPTRQTPGVDLAWAALFSAVGYGAAKGTATGIRGALKPRMFSPGPDTIAQKAVNAAYVTIQSVGGGAAGGLVAYVTNGIANVAGGERWDKNWSSAILSGCIAGAIPSLPSRQKDNSGVLGTRTARPHNEPLDLDEINAPS